MLRFNNISFLAPPLVSKRRGNQCGVTGQPASTEPLLACSPAGCRPPHGSLSAQEASAVAGETAQEGQLFKEQNESDLCPLACGQPSGTPGWKKCAPEELCHIRY